MKTRLMSTRYSGTSRGSTRRPASSATYQLRWTESRKSPRSCAYEVLKRKRTVGSDLLAADRAEDALRPHREHDQQDDVRRDVLEPLREIHAREELDEPDGHAADQRAWDRSKPAEHGCGQRLEPDEPEVDIDQRNGREQDPGDRGDAGGDGPDQREHPLDRNAHVVGGELILRRGLHRHAHPREAEERVERAAQHHRADDDRDVLVADGDATDPRRLGAE